MVTHGCVVVHSPKLQAVDMDGVCHREVYKLGPTQPGSINALRSLKLTNGSKFTKQVHKRQQVFIP